MKTIINKLFKSLSFVALLAVMVTGLANAQNALQFTSVNATPEGAIRLHWASNTNEVYEIDYADQLDGNEDGTTSWTKLYDDYPSHGTNTFIADSGNYDLTPEITHPKNSPMRFYRVMLVQNNDSASNPTVSIISPTNGATLSDTVTVQVSAGSSEILSEIKLYIDGEEQWSSDDGSNFVINTCEYPNGNHILFATAKSQSGLEGVVNGSAITYGRTVSSYINVNFSNLIAGVSFSEPYFEPALGQTQNVSATFAANCDWTLQIQDVNSNTVRSASGSGMSLSFAWDGTGNGETNIPDGVYTYLISTATNGLAPEIVTNNYVVNTNPPPGPGAMEEEMMWAVNTNESESVLPLAIFPPGTDTNGYTLFSATLSDVRGLMQSATLTRHSTSLSKSSGMMYEESSSSSYSGVASQSTTTPKRKPSSGVKGTLGTFGICYKTYGPNGFTSAHPPTGWPYPLPTYVAVDGQTRTALTVAGRLLEFKTIASDFESGMKKAGWKSQFFKPDDQWGATDIKKASLGGNSIFNTCNFGFLLTHGSYGNTGSTGTENDNVSYTYCLMGANNRVRLSDMDFGSSDVGGLRWMAIYSCNILKSENYTSMETSAKVL